jgi:hypothetical protein
MPRRPDRACPQVTGRRSSPWRKQELRRPFSAGDGVSKAAQCNGPLVPTLYCTCGLSSPRRWPTAAPRATSYRLDPGIKDRLEQQAAVEGASERALLERLISEGLDTLDHPGIVYRPGPTGRRAALAVGPDVWEGPPRHRRRLPLPLSRRPDSLNG